MANMLSVGPVNRAQIAQPAKMEGDTGFSQAGPCSGTGFEPGGKICAARLLPSMKNTVRIHTNGAGEAGATGLS
jgi:hypothetical protein